MSADDKRRFKQDGARNTAVAEKPEDVAFDLIPRHEWVLIKEMRQEEQRTEGGVVLPGEDFFLLQAKSSKHTYAVVVEIGDKVKPDLNRGDVVLVTKFSLTIDGVEQVTGDSDLRLVRDEEIYARVVKRGHADNGS
jgi:co-chaperonin GroES (HSP10)